MTEHSKADEARKGLIDSVKGKVKEIAGAVTGNDSLTSEGQLEQAQAKERKEANSVEAVADAEAAQAHAAATEARVAGAQERIAVNAQTAAVQSSVLNQQVAQKRAAEQVGQQEAAERKRVPSSTHRPRCNRPKPRSATKSIPRLKKSSTPSTIISLQCTAHRALRRKPIASDNRPTN